MRLGLFAALAHEIEEDAIERSRRAFEATVNNNHGLLNAMGEAIVNGPRCNFIDCSHKRMLASERLVSCAQCLLRLWSIRFARKCRRCKRSLPLDATRICTVFQGKYRMWGPANGSIEYCEPNGFYRGFNQPCFGDY